MTNQEKIRTPIYLIGFMGSGKSTTGYKLARKLAFAFVDLDDFIIRKYTQSISELFKKHGESGFREIERKALEELSKSSNCVISCGGGTPCFLNNMELMNSSGTTIYLQTDSEILLRRLFRSNKDRPLLEGKTEEELRVYINQLLSERKRYYEQAMYHIDGNHLDPERLIELIKIG